MQSACPSTCTCNTLGQCNYVYTFIDLIMFNTFIQLLTLLLFFFYIYVAPNGAALLISLYTSHSMTIKAFYSILCVELSVSAAVIDQILFFSATKMSIVNDITSSTIYKHICSSCCPASKQVISDWPRCCNLTNLSKMQVQNQKKKKRKTPIVSLRHRLYIFCLKREATERNNCKYRLKEYVSVVCHEFE